MRTHPIIAAVKHRDRIEVRYQKKGETRRRRYTFMDGPAMTINALDLLDRPGDSARAPEKNLTYERSL